MRTLEEIIEEQQRQIEELEAELNKYKNPPPNDWHSLMDAQLHIMLQKYYPDVDILREFVLGVQPPREIRSGCG